MKLLICAVLAAGCVIDATSPNGDSSLTVVNNSDFTIEELYVTASASVTWGPNLLGRDPLYPDDAITLSVDCDTYDVELVDEFDVVCTLYGLDLCFSDATWVIDNATCTVF